MSKIEIYFLHDPDCDGFETFATQAERDEAAKKLIRAYLEDGLWGDSVELLQAGVITHKATKTNVRVRPDELNEHNEDEDGFHWNGDADEMCDYELLPVLPAEKGKGKVGVKTITFSKHANGYYVCDTPNNQAGEYVRLTDYQTLNSEHELTCTALRAMDKQIEKLKAQSSPQQSDEVAGLVGLLKEHAKCSACNGKGQKRSDCTLCVDSTFDHNCNDEIKQCWKCNGLGYPQPVAAALSPFQQEEVKS